jgi:hypothetical protein
MDVWCSRLRAAQKRAAVAAHAAASFQPTFPSISRLAAACTCCHSSARGGTLRAAAGVRRLPPRRCQRQVDGPPLRVRHDDVRGRPARLQLHVVVDVTAWQMVFGYHLHMAGASKGVFSRSRCPGCGRALAEQQGSGTIAVLLSAYWDVARACCGQGTDGWGALLLPALAPTTSLGEDQPDMQSGMRLQVRFRCCPPLLRALHAPAAAAAHQPPPALPHAPPLPCSAHDKFCSDADAVQI